MFIYKYGEKENQQNISCSLRYNNYVNLNNLLRFYCELKTKSCTAYSVNLKQVFVYTMLDAYLEINVQKYSINLNLALCFLKKLLQKKFPNIYFFKIGRSWDMPGL